MASLPPGAVPAAAVAPKPKGGGLEALIPEELRPKPKPDPVKVEQDKKDAAEKEAKAASKFDETDLEFVQGSSVSRIIIAAVVGLVVGLVVGFLVSPKGYSDEEIAAMMPECPTIEPEEVEVVEVVTEEPEEEVPQLLVFDPRLWQEGNTWFFRYQRRVPPTEPSFLNLTYFGRRTITAVSPGAWGLQVTVRDEGGVTPPTETEYIVSASCLLLAGDTPRVVFCLPPTDDELPTGTILDLRMRGMQVAMSDGQFQFDPNHGWIAEVYERQNRRVAGELIGFSFQGGRTAGEVSRETPTCDWTVSVERGERLGSTARPTTPDLQLAAEWGLQRNIRRYNASLSGNFGYTGVSAWTDDNQTVLLFHETPLEPEALPPGDHPFELLDMAVNQIKVFLDPSGRAEWIMLGLEAGNDSAMKVIRLAGERYMETTEILPRSNVRSLRAMMLASEAGCFVQVRHGRGDTQRFGNFLLNPLVGVGLQPGGNLLDER